MEARVLIDERDFTIEEERALNQIKENRAIRKRDRIIKKRVVGLIVVFLATVSVLFLFLNGNADIDKLQKTVQNMEDEKRALKIKQSTLISELEEKKADPKIKEEALYKLGMQEPKEHQIVYISIEGGESKNTQEENLVLMKALIDNGL